MNETARKRYDYLSHNREPYLWRARRNALLTIPTLLPFEGNTGFTYTYEPYQSLGAEGVVQLSFRLMMALFPPGHNFFRLDVPEGIIAQAADDPQISKQITEGRRLLSAWEAAGQAAVDITNWRVQTTASLQQLLVAGNVLEYVADDNNIVLYKLDQYVVKRDWAGNLLELIIQEKMARDSLPDTVKEIVPVDTSLRDPEDVIMYTHFKRTPDNVNYFVYQEVNDKRVSDSEGEFSVKNFPYRPLRWTVVPGEDYGRSKMDEHAPDLRALEGLEKAMLEGSAMSSRHFVMLKPTATAGGLRKRIASARNGEVLVGDFDQIMMMSFENRAGMQTTAEYAQHIEQRLRYSFLLNRAVQRDAERVTATEIRTLVEELENVLGGVYATLSHEMMDWRLALLLDNLQRKEVIPIWPDGMLRPRVLTGIEALSRDRDVMRVRTAAEIIQMFGEPALAAIDITELLRQAFIGLGLHDVTLTAEQIEAKQQTEELMKGLMASIPKLLEGQKETQ